MSRIFFTSDPHLGHAKVAGLRGFADSVEHDEAIAANWRSVVGEQDLVWVLGDLAMNPNRIGLLADLPGRKRLIAGNHDRCHPRDPRAQNPTTSEHYRSIFEWVGTAAQIRFGNMAALASHFPYDGDPHPGGPDRDVQWRLRDCGTPLLHGHMHSPQRITYSAAGTLQIHVGLDAWNLTPVDIETIADLAHTHTTENR